MDFVIHIKEFYIYSVENRDHAAFKKVTFIYSFNDYFLSIYYVPGTVLKQTYT